MHNLDSLLNAAQDEQPRPGLLATVRRYEPALIALIGALNIIVIAVVLAWHTQRPAPGDAVPSPQPNPAPTIPGGHR